MDVLLAAGAVGLAGYALGKRRERRKVANGYVTYHGNGSQSPQYANIHYGKTGNNHRSGHNHNHHHHTGYQPTGYLQTGYHNGTGY